MIERVSRFFKVRHLTEFEYENPVQRAVMLVRLQPCASDSQKLLGFGFENEPQVQPIAFTDSFGNVCHMMDFHSSERSKLTVKSVSEVEVLPRGAAIQDFASLSWAQMKSATDKIGHWDYLADSTRVYASGRLVDFARSHGLTRKSAPFETLKTAAEELLKALKYETGTTEVNSKIEDCLDLGRGVCQDFTHIMLALGRSWGIPSRYVSGYLHLYPDTGEPVTENASHAWSEFYFPQIGWVGIDSTNNAIIDNRYIRVAVGRDYTDVAPTKGVVYGGGKSSLRVDVTLARWDVPQDGNASGQGEQ